MKNSIIALFLLIINVLFCTPIFAEEEIPTIKFNNKIYILKYAKSIDNNNEILNEFTTNNESADPYKWTEMVSIHYFPKTKMVPKLFIADYYAIQRSIYPQFYDYGIREFVSPRAYVSDYIGSYSVMKEDATSKYLEYNLCGFSIYNGNNYIIQFSKKYRFKDHTDVSKTLSQVLSDNTYYLIHIQEKLKSKPKPYMEEYQSKNSSKIHSQTMMFDEISEPEFEHDETLDELFKNK